MALHAARVIRRRHKAEHSLLDTDLSPEQRKILEEAFGAADKNGDGVLSADEYLEIFQSHGLTIGKKTRFQKSHPKCISKLCSKLPSFFLEKDLPLYFLQSISKIVFSGRVQLNLNTEIFSVSSSIQIEQKEM